MQSAMRATVMALLWAAVYGAAVSPEQTEPPTAGKAAARLSEMVNGMAQGQQTAAPAPQGLALDEDAVIVEARLSNRRALGRCRCDHYRNDAKPGSALCVKVENGRTICTPQHHHGCNSDFVACDARGEGQAEASPGPSVGFVDAEGDDSGDVYLNVNFQIHHESTAAGAAQLPTASQFVAALADMTRLPQSRVNVVTSVGASSGAQVRASGVAAQAAHGGGGSGAAVNTATVHATFAVKNDKRRDALEAMLQLAEELPVIGSVTYHITHVTILEHATHPLVCDAAAESVKADAAALLQQLVELKQVEVELLRNACAKAANAEHCNPSALQTLDAHIKH